MEKDPNNILDEVTQGEYKYGFYTDIEMEKPYLYSPCVTSSSM